MLDRLDMKHLYNHKRLPFNFKRRQNLQKQYLYKKKLEKYAETKNIHSNYATHLLSTD